MDWKVFVSGLRVADTSTSFTFNLPVTSDTLSDLQVQFRLHELPAELEALYKQTNGIDQLFSTEGGSAKEKIGELVWSAERVIETNEQYRTDPDFKELYMSFDQLFFVSDAGNGDLFGFVTLNGKFERNDIFVWNHEDDSRTWVAPNLAKFVEWWTNGTISV